MAESDLILGIDTGQNSAFVVTDNVGVILDYRLVKLGTRPMLERVDAIGSEFQAALEAAGDRLKAVVIEDVGKMHSIQKGAGRGKNSHRTAHSIASSQRDFAIVMAVARLTWNAPIVAPTVAAWYPRLSGHIAKKPMAVELLAAQSESRNPKGWCRGRGGKVVDHLVMAFGLAMYGHRVNHVLNRI